jgi:AcrR family transcriptional regulator
MAAREGLTHRERLRALTVGEIKERGYAQIAEGGPGALSLNAIARSMGMSGPALYRYFASREELMAALVTDSFEDLADTLTRTAADAAGQAPQDRLRAVARGFRAWALAAPHRYRLVFGSSYGTGALDPARIIPAASRSMTVFLSALADLSTSPPPPVRDTILRRQLEQWSARQDPGATPVTGDLVLGLVAWTRLHGIISLEIDSYFVQVGVDPARLYEREIEHLIAERLATGRSAERSLSRTAGGLLLPPQEFSGSSYGGDLRIKSD